MDGNLKIRNAGGENSLETAELGFVDSDGAFNKRGISINDVVLADGSSANTDLERLDVEIGGVKTEFSEHSVDDRRHWRDGEREEIDAKIAKIASIDDNAIIHVSADEPTVDWEGHWWFQDVGTPETPPPPMPPPVTYPPLNNMRTIELPSGSYQLECWGANGGTTNGSGVGGYVRGTINLYSPTSIHIATGQAGRNGSGNGGWNGGGSGGSGSGAGGGGASHVTLATNRGMLSDYSQYQSEVIIVAGAGGGAGGSANGNTGAAGGAGGGSGGTGGGAAGSFGRGGNGGAQNHNTISQNNGGANGGGGGGWRGGDGAPWRNTTAAGGGGTGGTSYIQTVADVTPEIPLTHGVMIAGNGAGRPANPNGDQGCVRITTLALATPPSINARGIIMRKKEFGVVHTFLPVDDTLSSAKNKELEERVCALEKNKPNLDNLEEDIKRLWEVETFYPNGASKDGRAGAEFKFGSHQSTIKKNGRTVDVNLFLILTSTANTGWQKLDFELPNSHWCPANANAETVFAYQRGVKDSLGWIKVEPGGAIYIYVRGDSYTNSEFNVHITYIAGRYEPYY